MDFHITEQHLVSTLIFHSTRASLLVLLYNRLIALFTVRESSNYFLNILSKVYVYQI